MLAEPLQLGRFFCLPGVLLASCASASVGLGALWLAGRVDVAQAPLHWAAWWVGDTLGVLVFAPVMLTLIGQPRDEWAPRRWPVALPLLVVMLLMGLGIREVIRLDTARQRQAFEREAEIAANAVRERLRQPLHALEAMRGLISETAAPDRQAFARASAPWLLEWRQPAGTGLERARRARPRWRPSRRANRPPARPGSASSSGAMPASADVGDVDAHVIRFIEPLAQQCPGARRQHAVDRRRAGGHRTGGAQTADP